MGPFRMFSILIINGYWKRLQTWNYRSPNKDKPYHGDQNFKQSPILGSALIRVEQGLFSLHTLIQCGIKLWALAAAFTHISHTYSSDKSRYFIEMSVILRVKIFNERLQCLLADTINCSIWAHLLCAKTILWIILSFFICR